MAVMPHSVFDVRLPNPRAQEVLTALASGEIAAPVDRSLSIVLFGPFGSGKTLISRLLPPAMELASTGESLNPDSKDLIFIRCQQGDRGAAAAIHALERTMFSPTTTSGRFYVVVDEVDNLSAAAQGEIYKRLQQSNLTVIFTTNYIARIDRGLVERSICIPVDAPPASALIAVADRLNRERQLNLTSSEIHAAINSCDGSYRGVEASVIRASAKTHSDTVDDSSFGTSAPSDRDSLPQCVADFDIPDLKTQGLVRSISTGGLQVPVDRSLGILIWGPHGSGKTTLAKLLPPALEHCSAYTTEPVFDSSEYDCEGGSRGLALLSKISVETRLQGSFSRTGRRYVTLNDVDRLSINAQRDLKSLMDNPNTVFIFTSSNVDAVDPAIVNRCVSIPLVAVRGIGTNICLGECTEFAGSSQ